jgi:hypothetical protein
MVHSLIVERQVQLSWICSNGIHKRTLHDGMQGNQTKRAKTFQENNNSAISGKTVTHKKSHGLKHRSVTQKNDTTAKFHCTKHGQNPSHNTDKCFTLKNLPGKAKGASSLGLTKKSFRKEINIFAKVRPKKKILGMFAVVLQEEHNKLAARNN